MNRYLFFKRVSQSPRYEDLPNPPFQRGITIEPPIFSHPNSYVPPYFAFPPDLAVVTPYQLLQDDRHIVTLEVSREPSCAQNILSHFPQCRPQPAAAAVMLAIGVIRAMVTVGSRIVQGSELGQASGVTLRAENEAPLVPFSTSLETYLPLNSAARRDTEFWNKPEFELFKKWVNQSSQIEIAPQKLQDFKRAMADILETFYHSPDYREFASTVSDPSGCGDLKSIVYIQLRTALLLYNGEPRSKGLDQIEKVSKTLHAIQFVIQNISQRAMTGDHSEHILSVLVDPRFKLEFGGNFNEIVMAHPYFALEGPIIINVLEDTRAELKRDNHLRKMVLLPAFSSLHEKAKAIIAHYDDKASSESEEKWDPTRSDHEQSETMLGIKKKYDAELAVKLRELFAAL